MPILNAQLIKKNGKNEFVVLSYKEFRKIQEKLEDYDDLCCLREAKKKEKDAPTIGMEAIKNKISKQPNRSTHHTKARH